MSEPDANATKQEPSPSIGEGAWQDKVLVDAVGYTKGLAAILDSLTDGFQRRGRELDDLRHRLTILQSERRSILDGRSSLDAQVSALTAERDELRSKLEERDRELETLRHEVAQGRTALEAHASQLEELRRGATDPVQQVEELREVVRTLERQLQRVGQAPNRAPLAPRLGGSTPPSDAQAPRFDLADLEDLVSDRPRLQAPDAAALTAERDELRSKLEERDRELETLRHEVAQGQAALDAHTREIQALRIGMAETVRQAEEIRKVLDGVEREREVMAHRQTVLEAELEAERGRVRETTARASQEQMALREDLADAENLLAEARKDIAASLGLVGSLRRTAEEERARCAALQEQLKSQTPEPPLHGAGIEAVGTLLGEIARALGGSADTSDTAASPWADLETLVQGADAATRVDQTARAVLRPLVEALRDLWPPAEVADGGPRRPAGDEAAVRRHAAQIADRWRQLLRAQPGPSDATPTTDDRGAPLAADHGARKVEEEDRRKAARIVSARDPRSVPGEGARGDTSEPAPTAGDLAATRHKTPRRRGSPSGMTVECLLGATGNDEARMLRGEIRRINSMGLLGAFDERLPEGRQVLVRFIREAAVVSCLGRVVRVLESPPTGDAPGVYNHLIRFERAPAASGDEPYAFTN